MAYIKTLFDQNFLEYASYVIKERAIPSMEDGMKPVQRRIMQSLFDRDDGKFSKVANIVGHAMQYHPHGDSSIYEALVNLANKEYFIERQGNFGNLYTGDPASASRYIECRLLPLAKRVLYNPKLTEFVPSYDGRREEPVVFLAKLPLPLILGAEGIAVGMSTKILPYNLIEVIDAEILCLQGKEFSLAPDLPLGGELDVSEYADGAGKVISRATIEMTGTKTLTITSLPYGMSTESLIASIEKAAKSGKMKIGSITDYTSSKVEIAVKLPRGASPSTVREQLFAFTDAQVSVTSSMIVIDQNRPLITTASHIIRYHAQHLQDILEKELLLEKEELSQKIFFTLLEQIFIEKGVYKVLENTSKETSLISSVKKGLTPYVEELSHEVTKDDIERLLRIPIRRISSYDRTKREKELKELRARVSKINKLLKDLVSYAVAFLTSIKEDYKELCPRKSKIVNLSGKASAPRAALAERTLRLHYDRSTGYLGHSKGISGELVGPVSEQDSVVTISKEGVYTAQHVSEKAFVGPDALLCAVLTKETLKKTTFSFIYEEETGLYYKLIGLSPNPRFSAPLVPEGAKILSAVPRPLKRAQLQFTEVRGLPSAPKSVDLSQQKHHTFRSKGLLLTKRKVKKVDLIS